MLGRKVAIMRSFDASEREHFASGEGHRNRGEYVANTRTSANRPVTPQIDQVSDTVAPWTRPVEIDNSRFTPVTPDLEPAGLGGYGERVRSMWDRLDDWSSAWLCRALTPKSGSQDVKHRLARVADAGVGKTTLNAVKHTRAIPIRTCNPAR